MPALPQPPALGSRTSSRLDTGLRYAVVILAMLCPALRPQEVAAQDRPERPEFVSLELGFARHYKVGCFTPVEVTIRGGTEPVTGYVELVLPDGDGYPSRVVSERPHQILPGQVMRTVMYVKPGRIDSTISAVLRRAEGGRPVASRDFSPSLTAADEQRHSQALLSTQHLYLMIGRGVGLEGSLLPEQRLINQEPVVAHIDSLEQLPTRWYGYDGVDAVLMTTSDPAPLRRLTTTSSALAALDEWVRMGGKLVLFVGAEAGEVMAPGAPLERFLPGRFETLVPLRNFTALEEYSGDLTHAVPITAADAARGDRRLEVPQLVDIDGAVEAREAGDLPLVVRSSYGFGQVVFVAVDLDRPPFDAWRGRGKFLRRLLQLPDEVEPETDQPFVGPSWWGENDLAGMLRGGLDQFDGVKIAPFWLVASLVFGYIILIGPVDYFLVRRVFKRMELTWITFPTIVVAVSLGAYFLASWMKGDQLLLNQVSLVDVDARNNLVRGTTWVNVFSPDAASYQVSVLPRLPDGRDAPEAATIVSWLGLPGNNLGGMGTSTGDPPLWSRPYTLGPQFSAMFGVPIQIWSTKSFTSRWIDEAAGADAWIEADLREQGSGVLAGRVTNRLDFSLDEAFFVYGAWVYPLGTLEPGESVDVQVGSRLALRSHLFPGGGNEELPVRFLHGTHSADLHRLLQQMMFYQAAGVQQARNATNRYQSFVDLSSHVAAPMRQAALVARGKPGGTSFQLNGAPVEGPLDRHWNLYRFLLPVGDPAADK